MQFLAYITSDKMSETLILWMIDAGNTEAVSGPLKRWISLVFYVSRVQRALSLNISLLSLGL